MNLEEIKKFLDDNKQNDQVKDFLHSLTDEKAAIEKFKSSKEFKDELQKVGDQRVTKALKTFEEETLPKRVDEKIKELYPAETSEQKRIRELEEKIRKSEDERIKEKRQLYVNQKADEMKVPLKLVNMLSFNNDDEVDSKIKEASDLINNLIKESNIATQKAAVSKPAFSDGGTNIKQWNKEDLKGKTPEEILKAKEAGQLNTILGR